MVKLPKSIIKKFGITKRAWAEFRKTRGTKKARPTKSKRGAGRASTSTRTEVRSPTSTSTRANTRGNVTVTGGAGRGNTTVNMTRAGRGKGKRVAARKSTQGGAKMAKRKRGSRRAAVKHVARKGYRRAKAAMETRPGKVLMAAGMAAAGGVVTSFVVNKTPKVKDMSQLTKSAIQGGAGLAAIFFGKKKWIKGLGAGAVIAAVFGVTKSVLKLDPLAGPSAGSPVLTPSQMRQLINNGGRMNIPASVRMGVPATVRMGNSVIPGTRSSGFGGLAF